MGNFRFYRRVSIFPGLSVNVSKSGPSLTVGMRGAHMTFGSKGFARRSESPARHLLYVAHRIPFGGAFGARDQPISESQQTTAHGIAQMIALMVIIGAVAFLIAIVGSVATVSDRFIDAC